MAEELFSRPPIAEGKTKKIYPYPSPDTQPLALMLSNDLLTKGDGADRIEIPGIGIIKTETAANCFAFLDSQGIRTHFVEYTGQDGLKDGMVVEQVDMIPLEVVVRGTAAGSYSARHGVPEGTCLLPRPVQFFYKDDAQHDPEATRKEDGEWNFSHPKTGESMFASPGVKKLTALLGVTQEEFLHMQEQALQAFNLLHAAFAQQGAELIDFKIEFGRNKKGELVIADVIDNDSWRLWVGGKKEGELSKQLYRDIKGEPTDEQKEMIARKYQQVLEMTRQFPRV